jgi:hypothetical protein
MSCMMLSSVFSAICFRTVLHIENVKADLDNELADADGNEARLDFTRSCPRRDKI